LLFWEMSFLVWMENLQSSPSQEHLFRCTSKTEPGKLKKIVNSLQGTPSLS
jgi:hypothetical protein